MFGMKKCVTPLVMGLLVLAGGTACSQNPAEGQEKVIRFTSVPDIFNWNISNPQAGWEETLDWFFTRLKEEGPDFNLNAGDIMDARWWDSAEQIRAKTEEYWSGFNKRYADHDITVYVAPGDHEYGDDGGLKRPKIARAFGQEFARQMGMPENGPEGLEGRAFWVREENLLVVTLDTFVDRGDDVTWGYTVGEKQLAWLDQTLSEHADADFVIVQGHLPIVGPVKSKNSSASMLEGGTDSELWKVMVKHGVDVYLCGEHHRITALHEDGIWQVVHGALWGTQTDLNYMRGQVTGDALTLELLEFDVEYDGGYIGDHPHRGAKNKPREIVRLAESTKTDGPRLTGRLVLEKGSDGEVRTAEATGWFDIK
jgi:DNA repair exonuclease SbcCD nuclease subunit